MGTIRVAFFSVVSSKVVDAIAGGVVFREVTDFKPLQPEKAPFPIVVTLLGMVREVKPLQPLKAYSPIDLTLLGMVTEFKPLQPEKARLPIDLTLLPMVNVDNVFIPLKGE